MVPVSVAGEDQLESVRLSIDKASIYEDEVTGVSMEALMSISGAASEDQLRQMGATITYLSRNEQIAVIDPESGEITGVSAGTVELAVAVSLNGVEKTGVAELTVVESPEPAQLLLDFSQLKSAQDSANNNKWTITEYGNANFTIDMAKSYHASHRVYSGASFGGFSAPHIEIGPQDMSWLKDQSRRLTIDFTVPASGIYTIDLTGGKWYAGGIADVFIDGQYLGDYDFCNYDESNALPRSMGEKKILKTVSLSSRAQD